METTTKPMETQADDYLERASHDYPFNLGTMQGQLKLSALAIRYHLREIEGELKRMEACSLECNERLVEGRKDLEETR